MNDVNLALVSKERAATCCKSCMGERMQQQTNTKGNKMKPLYCRFLCIQSFRYIMGHRPEGHDAHLNDCQIRKLDSLRGSW